MDDRHDEEPNRKRERELGEDEAKLGGAAERQMGVDHSLPFARPVPRALELKSADSVAGLSAFPDASRTLRPARRTGGPVL